MNKHINLSKLFAYAKTHRPSKFNLTLDERGFGDIDNLEQIVNNQKTPIMDLRKEATKNSFRQTEGG